ncbi:unnamed protein product, partial [Polarella glacialis]
VAELSRHKQMVKLFANPLGKACYTLDLEKVKSSLGELRSHGLMDAGLVFTSEVRPMLEDRSLSPKEWRQFQAEMGCQPLLLTVLACAGELVRASEASGTVLRGDAAEKAKAVQVLAGDIVKLLVNSGARIDLADVGPLESTALHVAASSGAAKLVGLLLMLGADVFARNGSGCSAEVLARRRGHTICEQILQVAAMEHAIDQEEVARELEDEVVEDGPEVVPEQQLRPEENRLERSLSKSDRREAPEERSTGGMAYGQHGVWSCLDKDLYPDDLDDSDLPDEWDEDKWGDYQDWGEEWEDQASSASDIELESEDLTIGEHELRALVTNLREEKTAGLQRLFAMGSERAQLMEEAQHLEQRGVKLRERREKLRDREERAKAGDPSAAGENAAETEVSAWWEERATDHARVVWELTEALQKQTE